MRGAYMCHAYTFVKGGRVFCNAGGHSRARALAPRDRRATLCSSTEVCAMPQPRCWLVCVVAFLPAVLTAQTGTVRGRVTQATGGQPVPNVQTMVPGTSLGTLTGDTGEYTLVGVPAGSRTVVARRIGFTEARQTVTVTDGQTVTADFTMSVT